MQGLRQIDTVTAGHERSVSARPFEPMPKDAHDAVCAQVDRLLANHLFSHSKRYPAFLLFIVQKTLAGRTEDLKERIIGMEVFNRAADYDANASPIVRVTAGEIRKRLELYYHQPGHENEIRIDLPIGGYIPTFRIPNGGSSSLVHVESEESLTAPPIESESTLRTLSARTGAIHRWVSYPALWAAIVGAVVLSSAFFYRATRADSVVDQFWGQVIASRDPVALCVARGTGTTPSSMGIVMSDVGTMSAIRDTLESRKHEFQVVNASTTDLSELRNDPVVFVGPYYTPWVKQVTANLRYHVVRESSESVAWIQDSNFPSQKNWIGTLGAGVAKTESYALVARFIDRTFVRPVVIATGLSPEGTVAAGEILTNPQYMDALLVDAPKDWQKMNLEAVIRTQIVDGKSGPPQVEAVYFWK